MQKKYILIDVDDVLLNWYSGFLRFTKHLGLEPINDNTDYDLSKRFGLSSSEMTDMIQFFNSRWEFGTLDPLPNSREYIAALRERGYIFVAITSCSTDPITVALRRSNLYWCFGDVFEDVHCVNLHESKETHLADYNPSWWIEDKFENALAGLKYRHKSILLTQPSNTGKEHSDIKRCDSWCEIYKHIINND